MTVVRANLAFIGLPAEISARGQLNGSIRASTALQSVGPARETLAAVRDGNRLPRGNFPVSNTSLSENRRGRSTV